MGMFTNLDLAARPLPTPLVFLTRPVNHNEVFSFTREHLQQPCASRDWVSLEKRNGEKSFSLRSLTTLLLTIVVYSIRSNFHWDEEFFFTRRSLFGGPEWDDCSSHLWIGGPLDVWNQMKCESNCTCDFKCKFMKIINSLLTSTLEAFDFCNTIAT